MIFELLERLGNFLYYSLGAKPSPIKAMYSSVGILMGYISWAKVKSNLVFYGFGKPICCLTPVATGWLPLSANLLTVLG